MGILVQIYTYYVVSYYLSVQREMRNNLQQPTVNILKSNKKAEESDFRVHFTLLDVVWKGKEQALIDEIAKHMVDICPVHIIQVANQIEDNMYDITVGLYNDNKACVFLARQNNSLFLSDGAGKLREYKPVISRVFQSFMRANIPPKLDKPEQKETPNVPPKEEVSPIKVTINLKPNTRRDSPKANHSSNSSSSSSSFSFSSSPIETQRQKQASMPRFVEQSKHSAVEPKVIYAKVEQERKDRGWENERKDIKQSNQAPKLEQRPDQTKVIQLKVEQKNTKIQVPPSKLPQMQAQSIPQSWVPPLPLVDKIWAFGIPSEYTSEDICSSLLALGIQAAPSEVIQPGNVENAEDTQRGFRRHLSMEYLELTLTTPLTNQAVDLLEPKIEDYPYIIIAALPDPKQILQQLSHFSLELSFKEQHDDEEHIVMLAHKVGGVTAMIRNDVSMSDSMKYIVVFNSVSKVEKMEYLVRKQMKFGCKSQMKKPNPPFQLGRMLSYYTFASLMIDINSFL